MVRPSEYLPEIWGGDIADEEAWESREQLQEFMELVTQHWNTINRKLQAGDVYLPILLEDDARRRPCERLGDRLACAACHCVITIGRNSSGARNRAGRSFRSLALANEHHPDPQMRPYKGADGCTAA